MAKYDTKNIFGSIELFPDQCTTAWNTRSDTRERKAVNNILVAGMGGSALGAYILQSLDIFTVPITMSHDYNIPSWVDETTLVLAISYSGTTEETLSATRNAIVNSAQVVCITLGGELESIAIENNLELRKIYPETNPCGQPRFGVGFMMMDIIKTCMDYGVCNLEKGAVEKSLEELEKWQNNFKENNSIDTIYKEAQNLAEKMPILVANGHLANVARFARNQMNETAKALAQSYEIPELNHHLMEGLEFPTTNKEELYFIFFESSLYSPKINKRISVTKDVLSKQHIKYTNIQIEGENKLSQVLIGMQRAMYLAYTLGIIHEKDPSDIKWVNYFKEQLSK